MDKIWSSNISNRRVVACNQCRLHLQALTISNICNASGSKATRQVIKYAVPIPSKLWWSQQEKPSATDRKICRKVLKTVFMSSGRFRTLCRPLGQWFANHYIHHRWWGVFNQCRQEILLSSVPNKMASTTHQPRWSRKIPSASRSNLCSRTT